MDSTRLTVEEFEKPSTWISKNQVMPGVSYNEMCHTSPCAKYCTQGNMCGEERWFRCQQREDCEPTAAGYQETPNLVDKENKYQADSGYLSEDVVTITISHGDDIMTFKVKGMSTFEENQQLIRFKAERLLWKKKLNFDDHKLCIIDEEIGKPLTPLLNKRISEDRIIHLVKADTSKLQSVTNA